MAENKLEQIFDSGALDLDLAKALEGWKDLMRSLSGLALMMNLNSCHEQS